MQKSTNSKILSLQLALKAAVSDQQHDDSVMATIADLNGFNINTFRSSINPTTTTHKANIHHLEAILSYTQDARIMDSICATHGNAAWFELPKSDDLTQSNYINKVGELAREQGELAQSIANAVADNRITQLEEDEIYKEVLDLVRVATTLLAMVKKHREQVM